MLFDLVSVFLVAFVFLYCQKRANNIEHRHINDLNFKAPVLPVTMAYCFVNLARYEWLVSMKTDIHSGIGDTPLNDPLLQ